MVIMCRLATHRKAFRCKDPAGTEILSLGGPESSFWRGN